MNLIVCPHCNQSYYRELYNTATLLSYSPVWKDGVCINPNPNYFTTFCECLSCGKTFSFTEHLGEITIND